jgi:hypothetical protein
MVKASMSDWLGSGAHVGGVKINRYKIVGRKSERKILHDIPPHIGAPVICMQLPTSPAHKPSLA